MYIAVVGKRAVHAAGDVKSSDCTNGTCSEVYARYVSRTGALDSHIQLARGSSLGEGKFSTVRAGRVRITQLNVAVKSICNRTSSGSLIEQEIRALQSLRHGTPARV